MSDQIKAFITIMVIALAVGVVIGMVAMVLLAGAVY